MFSAAAFGGQIREVWSVYRKVKVTSEERKLCDNRINRVITGKQPLKWRC